MDRRIFLQTAAAAVVPLSAITASYGLFEANWLQVVRIRRSLRQLPLAFHGLKIAFLADLHHGPFTTLDYLRAVVRTTLAVQPDLIVLGGDYSLKDARYIRPCFRVLAELAAPLGVYGVLGNHDYWHGLEETRAGLAAAKITELTNRGVWLTRGGYRLRLAGVDDLWMGRVDVAAAVGDATAHDACIVISHNPDVAETLRDERVGLVLSGHTHGGQVVFPTGQAPFVPSRYGRKYQHGWVQGPVAPVYVTRGLGCSGVPVRYGSRPELTLLTLDSPTALPTVTS
ncbi:MAG: metallophosphoesterase [Gemmataceae bacterium]|nr:metallophosphoesterase [Gemmata sp.]MDW8198299.1 metallophosphoesterase [Gemmataceae bacterium]